MAFAVNHPWLARLRISRWLWGCASWKWASTSWAASCLWISSFLPRWQELKLKFLDGKRLAGFLAAPDELALFVVRLAECQKDFDVGFSCVRESAAFFVRLKCRTAAFDRLSRAYIQGRLSRPGLHQRLNYRRSFFHRLSEKKGPEGPRATTAQGGDAAPLCLLLG